MTFFTLNRHLLLLHHLSELHFFPSNLHLYWHDVSFVKIFDSVIPVEHASI